MLKDANCAAEVGRLLKGSEAFALLTDIDRGRLASYSHERFVLPGELILRECDVGEEFFLIASGSVHVVGRAFDGTELIMTRLKSGQVFGEQALRRGGCRVRNASIRAAERCRLLYFPRKALLEALEKDESLTVKLENIGGRQAAERSEILRDKLLQDIGLGAEYQIERFEQGQIIFREGDAAKCVYLILEGTARVIRGEGEEAVVLSELLPGQFFGERAILNDAPRSATVEVTAALETAVLDGAWFRSALAKQPKLQSIMASLEAMYLLPLRGLITLQGGTLASQPVLTAVYHLAGGRRVITTRMPTLNAFSARVAGAPEADRSARFTSADDGALREIHLHRGKIVEIQSDGPWEQLGATFERLLDDGDVGSSELAAFKARGEFHPTIPPAHERDEVICHCSRVNADDLVRLIAAGYNTLEKLAAKSMATRVCGGCVPAVNEFLGKGECIPVVCDGTEAHAPDIRMFRLRVLNGQPKPFLPGQHVVLQARIGGRWIGRPYTISSGPGALAHYEITVKREEKGLLSRWLFESMDRGSALRISPPRGSYYLGSENTSNIVFLAGGIGITPGLAMARTYFVSPCAWRLHVDHSVSFEEQAIHIGELKRFASSCPGLSYTLRVTRRDGRLGACDIQRFEETHPMARYYLCGSPKYVGGVKALLTQVGIPNERMEIEQFSPVG